MHIGNKMIKVLQINVVVNQGSTGKIAEQIGHLVLQKGWRSVIAYGRWPRNSESELIRVGSDWDMRLHALESRIRDNHGLCSRSATKILIKQIKEINPDVIHLHNIHGYYLNFKILFEFLKEYNKPVVWTLHDCWSFTGHCAYYDFHKCEKWKIHCDSCPNKRDYPARWLYDRSYKNFEIKKSLFPSLSNLTLIPVSNWLKTQLEQSFMRDCSIRVIKNGIDLDIFNIEEKQNDGIFRILGVANVWDQRKGLDDFKKLRNLLPAEFEIILVGLKKDQIKNLPDGIVGITRTDSQKELAHLYAKSDVLVNPTYEDNFPTTNLEALASGTPVITYRTGGSPEAVDEKTGVVIDQGNVQELANAIIMMKDSSLSSFDCRKRAEDYFDKDKSFEKYVELYEDLLSIKQ